MTDHPADGVDDGAAGGAADETERATCYRHPDREAHIRCVRCNRRICPDCMIDASVGFQCPECVREGNQGVRRARTVFGGRVNGDPGYVTKALIGITAAVFLAQLVLGQEIDRHFWLIAGPGFDPVLGQQVGVADGELYRLLTAAFLHGGFLHLALNMYALFLFGPPLEAALGRVRFSALYLVSALGGSALSYAFSNPGQPSLGASGAVFGLLGAFLVVNRKLGRDNAGVFVLLAINFAFGFIARNIDWRAHLGGLIAGVLCAAALVYAPPRRRPLVQALGLAGVLLAVVALVLWRTAQLT
ncbi:MAG: rhomboid family intramembrane serine protease [Sporichthyaceae bacterium]